MRRSTALMAAAALLLLSSSLAVASMSTGERSEEEVETRRIFRDWMAKNEKTYSSIDEEEHRYAVFKEKLRRYGNPFGLIGFGGLTDEELGSLNTGCARMEPDLLERISRNIFRWVFAGGRDQAV
jgi:hypothetical protein